MLRIKRIIILLYVSVLPLNLWAALISFTNFEDFKSGSSLSREELQKRGFQTGTWDNSLATRTLLDTCQSASGRQSVRITYPKNGYGPSETGCQVQLKFEKRDEAYASYCLRFSENFSWGTTSYGGKLPGLSGGDNCSGGDACDGTNGFSARLMWRAGGKAVLYLYHMDKPDKFGEDFELIYPDGRQVVFERGKWYHVAERVKMNKDGSTYDGEVEIWINGQHVLLVQGLRFTSNGDKVDDLYISTFHGGDDETWCPTETCYTWLDDIRIGTSYEDVSYQTCRKPEIGKNQSLCTGAKSYTFTSDLSDDKREYLWLRNGEIFAREPIVQVWQEGSYVLITDSAWCSARDTVHLYASLRPALGGDKHLCATSFLLLDTQLPDEAEYQYGWEKDGVRLDDKGPSLKVCEGGTYTVKVSTANCDEVIDRVTVTSGLLPVRVTEMPGGTEANLQVSGESQYEWYADEQLTELLATGATYTAQMTTIPSYVYVKDAGSYNGLVGKKRLTSNAWTRSDFSESLLFTVKKTLTIDSLSIYPKSELDAVIRILDDQSGEVVAIKKYENLSPGENRLALSVTLSPGKYRMDALGTTAPLYHSHTDEDIQYPYELDDIISIDGTSPVWLANKPWYLYFYNWRISVGNTCAATPVSLKKQTVSAVSLVQKSKIEVYPKFTDGDLHIDGLTGKSRITIFNCSGRKKLYRNMKQENAYFSVAEWNSGAYVIQVEDESGTYSFHFIKF